MTLAVPCASCKHPLRFKPEHSGKRGRCPKCGHAFVVPLATPSVPVAQSAAPKPTSKPVVPSHPLLFAGTPTGAVPVSLLGEGWKVPCGEDSLPFGWLRRFLYESGHLVWLGRVLDESLFTLLSDNPNPSRPQKLDGLPPAVAEAVRIASAVGLPFDSSAEYLELNRLQIGYTLRVKAKGLIAFVKMRLRELVLGVVAFVLLIYAFLPLWGLSKAYKGFPTFTGWAIRRFRDSSLYGRLYLFPPLFMIGLFTGLMTVMLSAFIMIWPPAFLKCMARTEDTVLIAPGGWLFYSAFHQAAVFVPRDWPVVEGRFKKHYVALGYREDALASYGPLWIARLPTDWVEEGGLSVEPRQRNLTAQILTHAKSRFADGSNS